MAHDYLGNDVGFQALSQKTLKRKRDGPATVHDLLKLYLDSLTHRPAQMSGKEKMFLLGDLTLILSIREEIHQRLQAANPMDALCHQPIPDAEPNFVYAFLLRL